MEIPNLVFGDLNPSVVESAKKMNLGEEWVFGDPMSVPLHAIVSPANTLGEMSGGYDLVIRNKLGASVERLVMQNLAEEPILLGQARALETGAKIPWIIVVPTVIGKAAGSSGPTSVGSLQSKTPSPDVIERGTYNLMHEAFRRGIHRIGTVLLGGGVGGVNADAALRAMLAGYLKAYDEIDALIYSSG